MSGAPKFLAGLALMALVQPGLAQEPDQARYDALLQACYGAAGSEADRSACMGLVARTCQNDEEGGQTTLGLAMCNHAETQAWDVLLNQEYRATMDWAKGLDVDDQADFPEFSNREKTLRDAQRAWLAFREAECSYAYAQWGAGSMRHISGTDCYAKMTAERTVSLREKRERFR